MKGIQSKNNKYKQSTPCFKRGDPCQNCFLVIFARSVQELLE